MTKQRIDDFLDVKPVEGEVVQFEAETRKREKETAKPTEQDFIDDFNYARLTLHDIIEAGSVALQGAMYVAKESQNPRAFEVASTLLGQVSSAAKDLLSLTETATKITPSEPNKEGEDYAYVGSTQSLKKILDDQGE